MGMIMRNVLLNGSLALGLMFTVSACGSGGTDAPTIVPPAPSGGGGATPPVPTGSTVALSDRVSANDGSEALMVPAGQTWVVDMCDADVKSIMVHGALHVRDADIAACADGAELRADWIMVMGEGSALQVGTIDAPLAERMTFTLKGTDKTANANGVQGFLSSGTKTIMAMNGADLDMHSVSARKTSWTQITETVSAGDTQVRLLEAPGWEAGDQVVLAPSGYDVRETEELEVASVDGNVVTFTTPLRYDHYGEVQRVAGKDLDMRAEIGLLSRNIRIRGDENSEDLRFGGHVMIMEGGTANVSGVEFFHMGQQGLKGRYPFHWHAAGDVSGQWIRNSSVHKSFQRAYASHKSDNSEVRDNVAYHVANHAYVFAEDGDERNNSYIGNVGFYTYVPEELAFFVDDNRFNPSSQNGDRPGTFWGRSPNHTLIGNHAAGTAHGTGFFIDSHEAKEIQPLTAQAVFRDNLSHSNTLFRNYTNGPAEASDFVEFRQVWGYQKLSSNGVFVDLDYPTDAGPQDSLKADTDLANAGNVYEIRGFTSYKNGRIGAWTTTRYESIVDSVFADSPSVARVDAGIMSDTVLVGQSANPIGEPDTTIMCNSLQTVCNGRMGVQLQGESTKIVDTTFVDVQSPFIVFDGLGIGSATVTQGITLTDMDPAEPTVFVDVPERGMNGRLLDIDGSATRRDGPSMFTYPDGEAALDGYALSFSGVADGEVLSGDAVTLDVTAVGSTPTDYIYYHNGVEVSLSGPDELVLSELPDGTHYIAAEPRDSLDSSLARRRGNYWFTTYFHVGGLPGE